MGRWSVGTFSRNVGPAREAYIDRNQEPSYKDVISWNGASKGKERTVSQFGCVLLVLLQTITISK